MNKTELCKALREFLAGKEDVANEAAPALKLMRYSLAELERPAQDAEQIRFDDLNEELKASDATITQLRDTVRDREGYIYDLLADAGMVPEVDGEPVTFLTEAIARVPTVLDDLQAALNRALDTDESPTDRHNRERFIEGVRSLLDPIAPHGTAGMPLQDLWNVFEKASERYGTLEEAITERDRLLSEAEQRLLAIREKLGIPVEATGPVAKLELANIDLIMQQRQAAQDRLLVGRDEAPAEDTLEAILEQIITILRLDWQDVDTLPQHIAQLHAAYEVNDNEHSPWVQEGKRLRALFGTPNATTDQLVEAITKRAGVKGFDKWVSDAVDLAHAVRGNLAPENRVMAKAAEAIILNAPGGAE